MLRKLGSRFKEVLPGVEFCSLRYQRDRHELLGVRQDVVKPVQRFEDAGVMITVVDGGGYGYAATGDFSVSGLASAMREAVYWAKRTARCSVIDWRAVSFPNPVGEYIGPQLIAWSSTPVEEKLDMLSDVSRSLKIDDRIVDWDASLRHISTDKIYLTSNGGSMVQTFSYIVPSISATANEGAETQYRTLLGHRGLSRQGGMEVLDQIGFRQAGPAIAEDAIVLLDARDCPSGQMDVLLDADQMMLQIHESVGHPLELDRILGDERNYAGTSFVTPEMIGSYQYGSKLMNISFDPSRPEQFATYGVDDEGLAAEKVLVIDKGILKRALGSVTSQSRCDVAGVANGRACGWNRPPIDRMANLNLEPGHSSLDEMIASVEKGVYMKSNRSWSIDDSRNKFQFGCEWGRLIENGKLTGVVKNPNYRGISATFWRSLKMVGDHATYNVLGTPNCGKGEPNQAVFVGHASPACLFGDVTVFGGG